MATGFWDGISQAEVDMLVDFHKRYRDENDDALVASIAWQIAKDEGADGITTEILDRARKVAWDRNDSK